MSSQAWLRDEARPGERCEAMNELQESTFLLGLQPPHMVYNQKCLFVVPKYPERKEKMEQVSKEFAFGDCSSFNLTIRGAKEDLSRVLAQHLDKSRIHCVFAGVFSIVFVRKGSSFCSGQCTAELCPIWNRL